jgi:hypothetical protein
MADPVDREISLALWKLHIPHHATRRPFRTTSEGRRVLRILRREVSEL